VPYIGGGIGVMGVNQHLKWDDTKFFDTDLVFGFQAMAGLTVKLTDHIEWFTEWRYRGGSNPKFTLINPNDSTDRIELRSEYNTHSIMSGLRISLHR
jgi:opacity protein-like surface antigen